MLTNTRVALSPAIERDFRVCCFWRGENFVCFSGMTMWVSMSETSVRGWVRGTWNAHRHKQMMANMEYKRRANSEQINRLRNANIHSAVFRSERSLSSASSGVNTSSLLPPHSTNMNKHEWGQGGRG